MCGLGALPAYLCATCTPGAQRPEENIRSLELELQMIISHYGCWGSNLGPPEEQLVLWTGSNFSPPQKKKLAPLRRFKSGVMEALLLLSGASELSGSCLTRGTTKSQSWAGKDRLQIQHTKEAAGCNHLQLTRKEWPSSRQNFRQH